MGIPLQEIIEVTTFYNAIGAWDDAIAILDFAMENGTPYSSTPMQKNAVEPFTASPLLNYMAGWYSSQAGHEDKALDYYRKAAEMSPDYCFTFRVEELEMLRDVLERTQLTGRHTIISAISCTTMTVKTRPSQHGNHLPS